MDLEKIKKNPEASWRIATFAPLHIGDTVMATPLYQVLRKRYPNSRLTLISQVIPHPVLEGLDIFDEMIPYSENMDLTGRFDLLVQPIYCGGSEVTALLEPYNFTFGLNRLMEDKRAGLRNRITGFYSHLLFYKHQMELNEELARQIGYRGVMPSAYCIQGNGSAFEKWKGFTGLFPAKINLGRQWPMESWKQLARSLKDRVLFIGSEDYKQEIMEAADACGVPFEIMSTLKDYTALCRQLKVLVIEDSGPMHLAAAAGSDIVALFGKSSPVLLHPWIQKTARCIAVSSPNLCSPCDRSWSWRAREQGLWAMTCMRNISPEQVSAAVRRIDSLALGTVMIQKGERFQTKQEYLNDLPRQAAWFLNYYASWLALHGKNPSKKKDSGSS